MKTINVSLHLKNMPLNKAWDLVTDIEKYPQRIKYVKNVKVYGEGLGSKWDDITTILWIPMRIRHTVNSLIKNKEYGFIIPLYFGGNMEQKYTVSEKDHKSIINGSITFDLGNKILNAALGPILESRLKKMLVSSFQKTGGEIIYN